MSVGELALPLVCGMAAWVREPFHTFVTYSRWKSWLWGHENRRAIPAPTYCSIWKIRPCTSAGQESRTDHECEGCKYASPKGISTRELALPLISWVVAWMKERQPPPLPHPSSSMADWRAGPGVMRVGELAMSITSCNNVKAREQAG